MDIVIIFFYGSVIAIFLSVLSHFKAIKNKPNLVEVDKQISSDIYHI